MTENKSGIRIGIDLGGTKTEVIALESDNGKELYRKRVPSPRDDYSATIQNMANLVKEAEATLGRTGTVGVAIPGSIVRETGLVKNANSTWINHHPLDKDLGAALGRPVRTENDANCFAVSEATDGAGAGKGVVFGVILGTGSGAGLVAHGKLIVGLNGIGAEWGHNPLPSPRVYAEPDMIEKLTQSFDKNAPYEIGTTIYPGKTGTPEYFTTDMAWNEYPGEYCYCGRRGCKEMWIAGPGFKRDYQRVTGIEKSTHDIIADAEAGEPKAVAALERYADRLARSLGFVINLVDPDVIVLGGGMSNVNALYDMVPKIWEKYLFTDKCKTPLVPAHFGDSSGVRGAAWLWDKDGN